MCSAGNPRQPAKGIKGHPLYERIADRLAQGLGDTTLSMADDQDAHLVAFIAVGTFLDWQNELPSADDVRGILREDGP